MFYWITSLSIVLLTALDFISKQLVSNNMFMNETIEVIPGVFHLHHITNDGVAMSMLEGEGWFFIPVSILFVVFCLAILYRSPLKKHFWFSSCFVLIAAGGIGNLIDRIFLGSVIDFLQIKFIYFPWTFNVADCYVVVAVCILIVLMFVGMKKYENMPLRTMLFNIPVKKKEQQDG